MTVIDIITLAISIISIVAGIATWFISWRYSEKKEMEMFIADAQGHATILKMLRSSMNKKFDDKQREVVTKIIWRNSSVSLIDILKMPRERFNIFQGLADPSKYPWDDD